MALVEQVLVLTVLSSQQMTISTRYSIPCHLRDLGLRKTSPATSGSAPVREPATYARPAPRKQPLNVSQAYVVAVLACRSASIFKCRRPESSAFCTDFVIERRSSRTSKPSHDSADLTVVLPSRCSSS